MKDISKADATGGFSPASSLALIGAVLAVIGIAGAKFSPAPNHPKTLLWYLRLQKPSFTPPGAVFALAWAGIELGLSYGGYRLLRRRPNPARNTAVALWGFNMAMIGGWSTIFFGAKSTGASALASAGMIATATTYAATTATIDRPAAATAIPFIAWLGFATALAEEVWRRND